MNRDPLEDEIEWSTWKDVEQGVTVIEGTLGRFSKRDFISLVYLKSTFDDTKRSIAHDLLKAVYEGREREKREADQQFVGVA